MPAATSEQQERIERLETCQAHGEFVSRYREWPNCSGWSKCPGCEKEAAAQKQLQEERERQEQRIKAFIDAAQIPLRFNTKTLEGFQAESGEQRTALELSRAYVDNFPDNLAAGRCLLFCGKPGTGKTHLGCGILRALAAQGARVRYATAGEVIRMLRETWRENAKETEADVLKRIFGLHLLLIDEVGVQFGSDAEKVQLFEVIDGRYRALRPTIIISNLDLKGLTEYLGERAIDRLWENGGGMTVFKGKSWRSTQRG